MVTLTLMYIVDFLNVYMNEIFLIIYNLNDNPYIVDFAVLKFICFNTYLCVCFNNQPTSVFLKYQCHFIIIVISQDIEEARNAPQKQQYLYNRVKHICYRKG